MQIFGFNYRQHLKTLELVTDIINDISPAQVIELGTGDGLLSILIAMYSREKYYQFKTFDINKPKDYVKSCIICHGGIFTKCDIFDLESVIGKLIADCGKTLLICDNGDKIKEFHTFKKYLKTDDVILVHDYFPNREIYFKNIKHDGWRTCEVIESDLDLTGLEHVPYGADYIGCGTWRKC